MTKELTLQDSYIEHLKDVYSAENQIIKALPKIIDTVTSRDLKQSLSKHLKETEGQVKRIEQIFASMEASPRGKKCVGMEGLLEEGKEAMSETFASSDLMDSALIGGCQKVEHYEICGYKDLIHMAGLLGDDEAVDLLKQSLQEEEAADQKLAALGENIITPETVSAAEAM
jgi:ferritin-like metal-binding protein YciE